MRRRVLGGAAVLGLLIGITTTSWTGAIEPQSGKGVFAGLKVTRLPRRANHARR